MWFALKTRNRLMHSILNWSGKTESIVFDGLLTTQEGKGCGFNPRIIETCFSLALKKRFFFLRRKRKIIWRIRYICITNHYYFFSRIILRQRIRWHKKQNGLHTINHRHSEHWTRNNNNDEKKKNLRIYSNNYIVIHFPTVRMRFTLIN